MLHHEFAKSAIIGILEAHPDAFEVEWFTGSTSWGFTTYLKAKPEGFQIFMDGLAKLGLSAEVKRKKPIMDEAGQWAYELIVEVPDDWKEPAEA